MTSRASRLRSRQTARPVPPATPEGSEAQGSLGRVEQLVLRGDGLTTTSLEILLGETVSVVVDGHWQITVPPSSTDRLPGSSLQFDTDGPDVDGYLATAWTDLEASTGEAILVREILLVGPQGRVHGSAEVVARHADLPEAVATALASTDHPIGRLLRDHGVPVARELRQWGYRSAGARAHRLGDGLTPTSRILGRTYLMRSTDTGRPLAALTERFCPHVFAPSGPRRQPPNGTP